MNAISGWRLAICVAGLVAVTEAASYPECQHDPYASAVFLATGIADGEELDKLYDYYFVRALQKQMSRASFAELSRSVGAPAGGQQTVRPVLARPVMQEIDQAAVRKFTGLSGAAVAASVAVRSGRSGGETELFLTLQCADGEWKITGIEVHPRDRR